MTLAPEAQEDRRPAARRPGGPDANPTKSDVREVDPLEALTQTRTLQAPTPTGEVREEDDARLTLRGLRLARMTVAYKLVEGVVAVTFGLLAGLVSVVGFGLDSAIGAVSALLVAARLVARLRGGAADEHKERRVLRLVSVLFFLLAAYVTVVGVLRLVDGAAPRPSVLAIGLLVVSLVVMPLLAEAKRRVGVTLDDPLILADAAETRIGALLSGATLFGLVVFALTGAVWVDVLAGLVIAGFAIHEGRETWQGELVENHHAADADDCDPASRD